jgi:hypothetical protein
VTGRPIELPLAAPLFIAIRRVAASIRPNLLI